MGATDAEVIRSGARSMAADRRPKPCAACDTSTTAPVIHMAMRCGASPALLLIRFCPMCANLLRVGLGERVEAAIERTLNSAEFSEPVEGPDGVQAFTWRAA